MASPFVFALLLEEALPYFLETLQVRVPCHGCVLYSFFYIDWMLFEFVMIFEILKNVPLLTMWLNGRWFLQIVDRDF